MANPHPAARIESRLDRAVGGVLRRRGWRPSVAVYPCYGAEGWIRVLARILLVPPDEDRSFPEDVRGWRRFVTPSASDVPVTVRVGEQTHHVRSRRDGYLDLRVEAETAPGWTTVGLSVDGAPEVAAPVRVVGPGTTLGVVSDVDDTVMVTMLPRPLVAFWNAFVAKESARRPVPGMADLYREVTESHPDVFFLYLSTGAWNTAPAITAFLDRNGYPPGPLLLTDWGPTRDRWFRSGPAHKHRELRRLLEDLPTVRWLLVGDDGQHDPTIYAETAAEAPEAVVGVAIRQLTPTQQVLRHGTPLPPAGQDSTAATGRPEVRAGDGFALARELRRRGIVLGGR